jgi:hypothetical protein
MDVTGRLGERLRTLTETPAGSSPAAVTTRQLGLVAVVYLAGVLVGLLLAAVI